MFTPIAKNNLQSMCSKIIKLNLDYFLQYEISQEI